MKLSCLRCSTNEEYDFQEFNPQTKEKLLVVRSNSGIQSVKMLMDLGISHKTAKFITAHINIEYGICHRCNYEALEGSYVNCPTCNSLNFNWLPA